MKLPTTNKPFYKNRFVVIIFIIAGLAMLGKLGGSSNPKSESMTTPTDSSFSTNNSSNTVLSSEASINGNAQALKTIRKEKKIIEAIITEANVLYVSVKDDGTRRDGFAQYLCQILSENHAKANWVKVTRVGSTNDPYRDNAYGVLLGQAHCN